MNIIICRYIMACLRDIIPTNKKEIILPTITATVAHQGDLYIATVKGLYIAASRKSWTRNAKAVIKHYKPASLSMVKLFDINKLVEDAEDRRGEKPVNVKAHPFVQATKSLKETHNA